MGIGNLTPGSPLDIADAKYGASELRGIKTEIRASFLNFVTGNDVVTKTATELNNPVTDAGVVAALALKAPIASPTFTGTPAAPTAAADTSTTQLATTAFVTTGLALKAPLASPALTGVPTAPTAAADTSTPQLATTAFVTTGLALKANLASPVFTGNPQAPNQTQGDNDTSIANTSFVTTGLATKADAAATTAALNLKANIASPTFTGVPAAPTAAAGTSTTQLATTAFVTTADDLKANIASPAFTGVPAAPTAAIGTDTTQLATTEYVVNALTAIASYNTLFRAAVTMATSAAYVEVGSTWVTATNATASYSEVSANANGRLTAATTGTYKVEWCGTALAVSVATAAVVQIYRNGVTLTCPLVCRMDCDTSTYASGSVSGYLDLSATDYVSLFVINPSSDVMLSNMHFSLQRVR